MKIACRRFVSLDKGSVMFGYGETRKDLDWTMHERVDFKGDYTQVWSEGDSREAECKKLPLWMTSEL